MRTTLGPTQQQHITQLVAEMTLDEKLEQLAAPVRILYWNGAQFQGNERLGIPVMFAGECLHGAMTWFGLDAEVTFFPQSLALASTWSPDLIEQVATAIAVECRAIGTVQGYGPVLDVARDARFGRIEETFGEDPLLVSRMGVAYIHGLQGRGEERFDSRHVLATAKHFLAYHEGIAGVNGAPIELSERTLRDVHLPPFRAAIEAGLYSVMPAHNEVNGMPNHADVRLLRGLLREELGFEGVVVADNRDVTRLWNMHHLAENHEEAAVLALRAGVDQELDLQNDVRCYREPLKNAVETGKVGVELVNEAVERVLAAKAVMGKLERGTDEPVVVDRAAHRDLAREAAVQGITLLKNDGVLPLTTDALGSLAVLGPNADTARLGGYTSDTTARSVSVLDGIRAHVGDQVEVLHARGCDAREVTATTPDEIAEAVAAAAHSDVAVLILGDSKETVGEGVDRVNLSLPGAQQQLVEAVVATGTPTIVILLCGRPPAVEWIAENVQGILLGWFPGLEQGSAFTDVLFGVRNPSGKLPVTIPRATGQVPLTYMRRPSFNGSGSGRYWDVAEGPQWPFGYGLSYTSFELGAARLGRELIGQGESTTVSCEVRNTGSRAGDEVVQLYVTDVTASVGRAIIRLRGFERVSLEPGEAVTVTFPVGYEELQMLDTDLKPVVEPGEFLLTIGPDSQTGQPVTLRVSD